jgi:hypothetical protein
MKPASPALLALLASRQFDKSDLYEFVLPGGGTLRYTSGERDIIWDGFTWSAGGTVGPKEGGEVLPGGTASPELPPGGGLGVAQPWPATAQNCFPKRGWPLQQPHSCNKVPAAAIPGCAGRMPRARTRVSIDFWFIRIPRSRHAMSLYSAIPPALTRSAISASRKPHSATITPVCSPSRGATPRCSGRMPEKRAGNAVCFAITSPSPRFVSRTISSAAVCGSAIASSAGMYSAAMAPYERIRSTSSAAEY